MFSSDLGQFYFLICFLFFLVFVVPGLFSLTRILTQKLVYGHDVRPVVSKPVLHDFHVQLYEVEQRDLYYRKMSSCHLGVNSKFVKGSALNG